MMATDYFATLQKYWGYNSFRPLQEEIIKSVLAGNDTLGLMPTGGGKSLTFQVPAMTMNGICVVITPLIALMKDQVETLNKLNIKALAVHSGCTREEIDTSLNNCIYGNFKFLYVSPERTGSEIFRVRFRDMPVNLITVDEAHCISQWGYDFRPSYLKIAELRNFHPQVPMLALTATATPVVVDDIQEKLLFKKSNLLKTSFRRENLIYAVRYSENKDGDVVDMAKKLKGSGIIYVRSRQKSIELARILLQIGISAAYYNAGLDYPKRNEVQQSWTIGKIRIIVATNAFGMGIDKADVRFVIHADLPDSPEAYYQEAGRAGRDGNRSFAILLSSTSDEATVRTRIQNNFPDIPTVKKVYASLCNYLQIPVGSGKGMSYDFNIDEFSRTYRLSTYVAFSSLKLMESEGYIELTEEFDNPSRIKFLLSRDDLYRFQVSNLQFDAFIKLLLRSFTGLFTEYVTIDETVLAKRANVDRSIVRQYLKKLASLGVINFIPQKRTPMIIFIEERLEEKSIFISKDHYHTRKLRYTQRAEAILQYSFKKDKCRSQLLLEYFKETDSEPCGECDVCRAGKETALNKEEFTIIKELIIESVKQGPQSPKELPDLIGYSKDKAIQVIQWMLDNDVVRLDERQMLIMNNE